MKKIVFLFFLALTVNAVFCQEVIIGGINKNRLLTWSDFTGEPDRSSSFGANTHWNIFYRYETVSINGDTVKFIGLSVRLELDGKLSWVKEEKQTPYLLNHEQGHFNISLICQNEFIKQVNNTVFLRSDYNTKLKAIFHDIMDKYRVMNVTYDDETNHSKNRESQEKWNDFISKELISRSISF